LRELTGWGPASSTDARVSLNSFRAQEASAAAVSVRWRACQQLPTEPRGPRADGRRLCRAANFAVPPGIFWWSPSALQFVPAFGVAPRPPGQDTADRVRLRLPDFTTEPQDHRERRAHNRRAAAGKIADGVEIFGLSEAQRGRW